MNLKEYYKEILNNLEAGRAAVGITGILKPREMNEAKLQFKRKSFDADKLFGAGGRFDPADPSAPKERSFVTPKEPSAAAKKPKKIKKPKKKTKNLKTELGIGFTIDSPLHSSKDAHTSSATETPDGDIMSFHNEALRHVATRKDRMVPLHVLSQRKYIAYPDLGATQFTIHTSNGGDIIHTYIRPDEGQHDGDEGYEPLLKQKRFDDEIPGHTSHPDAPFRLNHEHAEDIINGHLLNIIRNGKSKGKTVAEHHGRRYR